MRCVAPLLSKETVRCMPCGVMRRPPISSELDVVGDMQAKKDGGRSFMCAESSAWRTDSKCSESASDFMTAGERFGEVIPAVPKGFVRWVQLDRINRPNKRKHLKDERKVYYIYCGEGDTVPDTRGWEPFGAQLAAAMADRRGSQRILALRTNKPSLLSVKSILKENPVLVSAGVTLDDFGFKSAKSASTPTVVSPEAVVSAVQQPSPELPVPPAAAPLEAATSFAWRLYRAAELSFQLSLWSEAQGDASGPSAVGR